MKYSVDGQDDSKTIEKYEICNDTIVITFLDGSVFEIPNTFENEQKTIEVMIKQAYLREELVDYRELSIEQEKKFFGIIFHLSLATCMVGMNALTDSTFAKTLDLIAAGTNVVAAIAKTVDYVYLKKYIEEVKKYNLYLQMNDSLTKADSDEFVDMVSEVINPNLYSGVDVQYDLNINTLDNFTLKEIEQISENLDKIMHAKVLKLNR